MVNKTRGRNGKKVREGLDLLQVSLFNLGFTSGCESFFRIPLANGIQIVHFQLRVLSEEGKVRSVRALSLLTFPSSESTRNRKCTI
jgi:hypothetical protein